MESKRVKHIKAELNSGYQAWKVGKMGRWFKGYRVAARDSLETYYIAMMTIRNNIVRLLDTAE